MWGQALSGEASTSKPDVLSIPEVPLILSAASVSNPPSKNDENVPQSPSEGTNVNDVPANISDNVE
ncbi:hypothetical protein Dimus_008140, partial [Dionaea muscipula]